MDDKNLIKIIAANHLLIPYIDLDDDLRQLIDLVNSDESILEQHMKKIILGKKWVPVREIDYIYRRRLLAIPPITQRGKLDTVEHERINRAKIAIEQILVYTKQNPGGYVKTITFNCSKNSYIVYCGELQDKIDVICILKNVPIPARVS